ncbi:MAG: hypothetical protein R3F55_24930 [Alphaproteobacteria bacterium]
MQAPDDDEDDDLRPLASPPCLLHELDPAFAEFALDNGADGRAVDKKPGVQPSPGPKARRRPD